MKRIIIGLFGTIILSLSAYTIASADVQDFVITDFTVDYYLSKDKEGRSFLKTVESITAQFPKYDQNHGIERFLHKSYDGHSVNLKLLEVNDKNGNSLDYRTYSSGDNLAVRIGDENQYVHGEVVYEIIYTQHDVTKYFTNNNTDEFYWDTNGLYWSQPFSQVKARIHIDSTIIDRLNGNQSCYYGSSGSTDTCNITKDLDGNTFTASVNNLLPKQNMTIAIGFLPKSFETYMPTRLEQFINDYGWIMNYANLALLALMILIILLFYRGSPRKKAVIAQYVPPKDVELSTIAMVLGRINKLFAAGLLSMAVSKKIKITEIIHKILFYEFKQYKLDLISVDKLTTTEREIALVIFENNLRVGPESSVNLPNYGQYFKILVSEYLSSMASSKKLETDGYQINKKITLAIIRLLNVLQLLVIGSIYFLIPSNSTNMLFYVAVSCVFISFAITGIIKRQILLSSKGRELVDYLEGLKLFIKTTELERIKMLQSPDGVERQAINTNSNKAVIRLYEKLLPYAVIFGLEKKWSKELAIRYSEQSVSPDWFNGVGAFGASSFASSVSSFSSSSSPSSSSDSGGSDGGGSSGGGGGGGGGGGW